MTVSAYDRVPFRGVTVNRRMKRALEWAERQDGVPTLQLSQGAYSGSVAASGSTHDGGGSVDIRTSVMSEAQRRKVMKALKRAGWAAWYRDERDGFSPHIHAVLIGDKQASNSARWQMGEFDAGRNGLTSQRADRNPWRPKERVRFSFRQKRPVPR